MGSRVFKAAGCGVKPPTRLRVKAAWRVLRGRSVMYRCVLVLDPFAGRLYVAGRGRDGRHARLMVSNNMMAPAYVGSGEVACFDWDAGIMYPLQVDGTLPR